MSLALRRGAVCAISEARLNWVLSDLVSSARDVPGVASFLAPAQRCLGIRSSTFGRVAAGWHMRFKMASGGVVPHVSRILGLVAFPVALPAAARQPLLERYNAACIPYA